MSERSQLRLKDEWLSTLGQRTGPFNVLSPFGAAVDGAGDATAELQENGILDASGQLAEPAGAALRRLAQPQFVSRLLFHGPPTSLEYVAYFDGTPETISLVSTDDGYLVQWPAGPEEVVGFLVEYAGMSSEATVPLTIQLPYLDARVALACVDMVRSFVLGHIALEKDLSNPVVDFSDVVERLGPDSINYNRLESVLRQLDLGDDPVDPPEIKATLDRLTGMGLLEAQPTGGWVIKDALSLVLDAFLFITGHYRVDTMAVDAQGSVSGSRAVVAQAGQRSLLYMEPDEGGIRMAAVSGQQLAEIFAHLFTLGDNGIPMVFGDGPQPTAPPPAPEAAPAAGPKFCGKCGTAVEAGTKFCGKCGNAMG